MRPTEANSTAAAPEGSKQASQRQHITFEPPCEMTLNVIGHRSLFRRVAMAAAMIDSHPKNCGMNGLPTLVTIKINLMQIYVS